MKILVIGSKGFIGSHCVDYFSKENDVWGCDVVIDYNQPNYSFIESIDSNFSDLFLRNKFDVCLNCSGAASVPFSLEKPLNDFNLNTLNVCKILDDIRQFNPECKYISMSSAAVYGNPEKIPIKESDNISPVSPYGYHKVMAENICSEYSRFWSIKTCCLRIFSAYGPRLRKQLFWDMYNKFTFQDKIELWGTGRESRDFIFISDIIQIIELAMSHSTFDGQVVNVANGEQIMIADVADTFVKELRSTKPVSFNNAVRKGDPLNWEADIAIAKSWGYKRTVSLVEGIKKYVSWIEKEQK